MKKFSCTMSIANWCAIEKAGGKVCCAGTLWLEYYAEAEITVPFK